MKILIIENVWLGGSSYRLFEKQFLTAFSILPTLHARQIAAITPKHHRVHVLNERYEPIRFDNSYDLVHINFTTSTALRAYEIADTFRQKGIPVVLSGLHASAVPEEVQHHADSVLLGRGELNWLQLLDDFDQKTLKPMYQPIPYTDSTIIPPTNINLPGFVLNGAIEATRGCPYKCLFCPEGNIPGGNIFYMRPVEDVIEEIQGLPYKMFNFYDASLTINPNYTKQLFSKMRGLKKSFSCNGNVDILATDTELIDLSKEAGCKSWLIGFESFSQCILDTIGKRTNKLNQYTDAVNNIQKRGMAVIGDFMFGFDGDTPDIFQKTLHFIKELHIDAADFNILTPFPGTPLYKKLESEGRILTKDWSLYNMKNVVFQSQNLTPREITLGVKKLYYSFYSMKNSLKRMIRGFQLGLAPFFIVVTRNYSSRFFLKRLKGL